MQRYFCVKCIFIEHELLMFLAHEINISQYLYFLRHTIALCNQIQYNML